LALQPLQLFEADWSASAASGPTELDEPRLIGMKVQSKASESCLEISKELLCLVPVFEIGISTSS